MITPRHIYFLGVFAAFATCGRADTPAPAHTRVFASPDGSVLVRIVPGNFGGNAHALATVLRYDGHTSGYQKTGEFALRNQLAPIDAVVTDDMQYVVTFDDWGEMGRGQNTVVIYRGSGEFVKAWTLRDIFTNADIERLPKTSSSIWWHGSVGILPDEKGQPVVIINPEEHYSAQDGKTCLKRRLYLDLLLKDFQK